MQLKPIRSFEFLEDQEKNVRGDVGPTSSPATKKDLLQNFNRSVATGNARSPGGVRTRGQVWPGQEAENFYAGQWMGPAASCPSGAIFHSGSLSSSPV